MINIFILNWNSSEDVASLLHSLKQSTYRTFRIILIHNATADEAELCKLGREYGQFFEIHLLINDDNLGYAGGNNQGLSFLQKQSLAGDVLILNPDVIVQPDTLTALVKAKGKNVGAVMIRTYDERQQHLYDFVKLDGFKQTYGVGTEPIYESDYAAGSCLLLDRSTIDLIGLFDSRYFMYWEEVDLSLRIKQNGKKIVSTTNSFITRKSNPSERSPNAIYYSVRNSFLIRKKYANFSACSHIVYVLKLALHCFKCSLTKGVISATVAYLKGLCDGLRF